MVILEKIDNAEKITIYGAGVVAERVFLSIRHITKFLAKFQGFVVTNKDDNPSNYLGYPVMDRDDLTDKSVLVLIGVKRASEGEVIDSLHKSGFFNICTKDDLEFIPDEQYCLFETLNEKEYPGELKKWYKNKTGRCLDLENPKTYNEKIQWMKLYDNLPQKTLLADKYLVREWVKQKIGDSYLIPILGVWNSFDEIDFDDLPNGFVLKCNHGSGWNTIVHEKNKLDLKWAKRHFDYWMGLNYAYSSLELHYRKIKPVIIAEQLLLDNDGGDLKDYKFFVFDGKVKLIQVDIDRFHEHKRNLYTPEWEYVDGEICYPTAPEIKVEKPGKLDEMIKVAETLGSGFYHVRVDLYLVNNHIYFGEMTFTHGSGVERFYPEDLAFRMGDWINIPVCANN